MQVQGATVAAVVMMTDVPSRRSAEDQLAREITKRGGKGVPMYTILANNDVSDEKVVRDALIAAKVDGVVVMRPAGVQVQANTPVDYSMPPYNTYWSGYHSYGWGTPWPGGTVPYDTIVFVDTLIYSLPQNQLVWAGRSKTTNPESVPQLVSELATATADELGHLNLVAKK
ncbi:MAG TPA: hypothetical protein VJR89_07505 [Polyangiales bacterium]|nr:hypothetical protein [Polyangiales bacterium]